MKAAIVGGYQRITVEKPGFNLLEILSVTAFAGSHADVVDRPPLTGEQVIVATVDDGFLVDVVRIIGTNLDGFVRGLIELWKLRIIELYVPLECRAGDA